VQSNSWVFGGGGVAAIAWEIGVLAGLDDEGVRVGVDDHLLGTSAGAVVAAQLASELTMAELYERQRQGVPYEMPKGVTAQMILTMMVDGLRSGSASQFGRRIGPAANAFGHDEAQDRRQVIEARLPSHTWGSRDLQLVAVDAASGDHRLFSRADGVPLVDAVMASCAIPLIWPTVAVDGNRYMDGGMRSPVNLDLALGAGPVIALAATTQWHRWARFSAQCRAIDANRTLTVVSMSRDSRRAQGRNPMNIESVPAVAAAGRDQGRQEAARIRASRAR
jgi:NTE family protein